MILLLLLLIQTVAPYPYVQWDQPGSSLTEVQSYSYKYRLDGATSGQPLSNVSCVVSNAVFQCLAPLPVTVPGKHTVAVEAVNDHGASVSTPVEFEIEITQPAAPLSVIIQ